MFDVRGSLQKTLDVFSPDILLVPLRDEDDHKHNFSSSSSSTTATTNNSTTTLGYSFELHTRLSVEGRPDAEDYRMLTLARLGRDSARVSSILQARAAVAVKGTTDNTSSVGLARGSGGGYLARLGVGTPPMWFYLVADTGSDLTWLQCEPCNPCIPRRGPNFDPSDSFTYHPIIYDSAPVTYGVEYGDGSYTAGDLASESVTFFGRRGSSELLQIGCGFANGGTFAGGVGILGLGRGPDSFPSQMNLASFSYCLVDKDFRNSSTLEFIINSSPHTPPPADAGAVVASLIRKAGRRASSFYYVDLIGISIGGGGGGMIPIGGANTTTGEEGGVILDSGTTLTYLQLSTYVPFRQDFLGAAAHNLALVFPPAHLPFDTCFDLSNLRSVDVPTVSFHFAASKKPLLLPPENYLLPVDSNGTHCLAFIPMLNSSMSIIGNVQQQGMRVTYDLAKSQIRFRPNQC